MLVIWDLGFSSSLVLVLCLAFSLFVRRKWRVSAARKEEIRRLLAMASEEAARAELEHSASCFSAAPPSASWPYQCAVCFSRTTTRCGRCKAVRYCSGKCQILHWRQGHKEECHRPKEGTDFELHRTFPEQYVNHDEDSHKGVNKTEKLEPLPDEVTSFNSSDSTEELYSKRDSAKSNPSTGNSSPESSSATFSGFSSSSTGSESSDEISVCESISSVDSRKCSEPIADDSDTTLGTPDKSNASIPDSVKPVSPKFASLVDSVGGLAGQGTLKQSKSGCGNGQARLRSTNASNNYSTRPGTLIEKSDFWESATDSDKEKDQFENFVESFLSSGKNTKDVFDSGSTLRFSFNLLKDNVPTLCKQASETSGATVQADKLCVGSASPNQTVKDGASDTDCESATSERTTCVDDGDISNSLRNRANFEKSREVSSSSLPSANASVISSLKTGTVSESMDVKSPSDLPASTDEMKSYIGQEKRSIPRSRVPSTANLPSSTDGMNSHIGDEKRSIQQSRIPSTAPDKLEVLKSEARPVSQVKLEKVSEVDRHVGSSPQAAARLLNHRNGLKSSVWKVIDQLKGSMISKHNQLCDISDEDGKTNEKGLFSYEFFIRLYVWRGAELHPCGLINCGNSCYANAVLQCLAFTPPLTSYFVQGLHKKACRKRDWCFTCEFEGLILKFKEGKSPVSPIGIVSHLKSIGSQLGHGREEDAHEFLRYAIDKMQSVCLMESGKKTFSSTEEESTLIGFTFGGYFRSKIRCTRCQGKSERHERMMDLTVEIEGDIGTLEEALRQFTRTETLDGENKYRCSRCKSHEKARKKLTVLKAPNILTIALKRFQSGKFGKLNKLVRFPEHLDLTSFMSGTHDKPEYKLYGVIVHVDIMNAAFSGHYVCYIKDSRNRWFKIDDSTVMPVEIEKVLSKGAYMLFYARSQPMDPKSAKNKAVPPVPVKNAGKDPTHRSQCSANSHRAPDRPLYTNSPWLQRTLEDSSSDNSSLFSGYSDEGSCSTASTRDSTSFDDLSDYIFGDSSTLSGSHMYSRYAPGQAYEELGGRGRMNLRGEGRESDPFLNSDVTTKSNRDGSSSFSNVETEPSPMAVVNQLFGDVKYNVVPSRKTTRGRRDY